MKNIFYRLWAIYALLLFIITLIIVLIPVGISLCWKEPHRGNMVYSIYRIWMKFFLPLVGIRVDTKGLEHFQPNQGYIITPNHRSFLDIMVTVPYFPGPSKTLAKSELAKIPIFGIIYRSGSVLVDRSSEHSRKESIHKMKSVLNMGQHLCLYPEGTRNKTKQPLQDFYKGAFKTALQTQHSIIPCLLFNTDTIFPPQKTLFLKPGKVHLHFLPAIDIHTFEQSNVNALKEHTFNEMWAYYEQNKSKLA